VIIIHNFRLKVKTVRAKVTLETRQETHKNANKHKLNYMWNLTLFYSFITTHPAANQQISNLLLCDARTFKVALEKVWVWWLWALNWFLNWARRWWNLFTECYKIFTIQIHENWDWVFKSDFVKLEINFQEILLNSTFVNNLEVIWRRFIW
jgi:hypothetical protein